MKKKVFVMGLSLLLVIGSFSFANPIEIYSDLTGQDESDVRDELRDSDVSLYDLAEEDGVLDELKTELLAEHKERLADLLEDGRIDQERYDELLADYEERINDGDFGMRGFGRRGGERAPMAFDAEEYLEHHEEELAELVEAGEMTEAEKTEAISEIEAILAKYDFDNIDRDEFRDFHDEVRDVMGDYCDEEMQRDGYEGRMGDGMKGHGGRGFRN